jgi:hypothetical protein
MEATVLDVFRFAWFAVRTFAGLVLLVLTLYAAMWAFVKILSAAPGNDDSGATLRRVKSYNALRIGQERKPQAAPPTRARTPQISEFGSNDRAKDREQLLIDLPPGVRESLPLP